jgi:hypothetical protein
MSSTTTADDDDTTGAPAAPPRPQQRASSVVPDTLGGLHTLYRALGMPYAARLLQRKIEESIASGGRGHGARVTNRPADLQRILFEHEEEMQAKEEAARARRAAQECPPPPPPAEEPPPPRERPVPNHPAIRSA